jgi:phage shock protein A
LRRKIAARRDGGARPGREQAVTSERSKQVELLECVYLRIADMTQSRERVQGQITALEELMAKLEHQISKARQSGREDLAQEALTRLNSGQSQIAALKSQLDQVLAERVKFTAAAQRLQTKIDGAGGTAAL